MKAHKVKPLEPEVVQQACCECGRMLQAPWGRVEDGKWVCSRACGELHELNIPHIMPLIRKIIEGA